MTIIYIILSVIGVLMSICMIGSMICTSIKERNIKKYGCWWGNCSKWQEEILDKWGL